MVRRLRPLVRGLIVLGLILRGAVENGRRTACDGLTRRALEIENDYVVLAFVQPRAGQVESHLGADVPDAAQRVAVDPDEAFGECAGVEEGVAYLVYLKCAAIEAGAGAVRAV